MTHELHEFGLYLGCPGSVNLAMIHPQACCQTDGALGGLGNSRLIGGCMHFRDRIAS